jgi:beta-glucosidase
MPASPEVGAETIEGRAHELLAQLSSAEKLALLDGDTDFWPGMVDIASRDASHVHPWPAGAVPRLGLDGLRFVDGPRGVVLKGGATTFPPPIARGACWDADLEERIGEAMAREARSFGANWLAAVCVNLLRHPGWGRAQETYGEDPVLLGALGAACTRGIQRHAVACVKHFALNSIDSSRFLVDVQVSERVLHELYLPHFRACVEAGAGSVMSAYNQVNGEWCGQHPGLLTAILKQRWGFRGFVVTDFIFGVRDGVAAVRAGQDLEMPFRMIFAGGLEEALADGRLPLDRLDDAVLRQLRVQLAVPEGSYPVSLRGSPEHRALAKEAACKAIVLLKNEAVSPGSPLLPLDPCRSLAVIGPLAAVANLGDRGSSDTRPEPGVVVTPLEGLRAAAAPGAVHHVSGERLPEAVALAAACESVLLVLGLDWHLEGEHIHPGDIAPILRQMPPPHPLLRRWWPPVARAIAAITSYGSARQGGDFAAGDRTQLELPAEQVALIEAVVAANPRTVVVLMGGGAILMEAWRRAVPAILLLWYPGERGGEALADVVFGAVSPSGRLPFAIPTSADHLPPFEPRARQVRYDLWHGYRRLQRDGHPAAFPFGFGLSYGALRLSDAQAELSPGSHPALRLAVTLHNDGAMASDGVVQVYVEPPGLVLERPRRTLVGFGRVSLEPGGCQRLRLAIPLRRLAYFDQATSRFWLEAGTHRLRFAQHSEDAGLLVELVWAATDLGP